MVDGNQTGSVATGAATAALFGPAELDRTIARRDGRPVGRRRLLRDACGLAAELPRNVPVVNCCRDRYDFLVVFVACLIRGHPAILPGDKKPAFLHEIQRAYPNAIFVTDQPLSLDISAIHNVAFGAEQGPEPVGSSAHPAPLAFPLSQPAAVVFSSGSTGRPEATIRTWGWLVRGAEDYVLGLGLDRLPGASIVATVPSQHSYGLETACMMVLRHDAAINSAHPLFPADIARSLKTVPAPRVLVSTPYHLDVLMRSDVSLPQTDLVVSATAPLGEDLAATVEQRLGGQVREVYGCTEIGLIGTRRTLDGPEWDPGRSLSLTLTDERAEISAAHLPQPIALDDILAEGVDGRFRLTGRQRDIVKVGGNRASLEGLNTILHGIEGVRDGALFPLDAGSDGRVARIAGVVVLGGRDLAEVARDLRARLPAAFWPRPLKAVDRVPRGPTGKLRRDDLLSQLEGGNANPKADGAS